MAARASSPFRKAIIHRERKKNRIICILRRLAAADALMNGWRAEANGRTTHDIIPRFLDMSLHRTWYPGKVANRGFQPVCHGIPASPAVIYWKQIIDGKMGNI